MDCGFQLLRHSDEACHHPRDITDSDSQPCISKEGSEGYRLFAFNCTSQAFTDGTTLRINLYPLEKSDLR